MLQRDRAANFQSGFIYVGEDHAYLGSASAPPPMPS